MAHPLSPTVLKVLDILNDGLTHGGNDIASALGISRTAVWKIIQQLKGYDIDMQSLREGYRLGFPLLLLDQQKIERLLGDFGVTVSVFESISSTNDYLISQAPFESITVCLAEYQSQGKGRLGRAWFSPFGRNIYCSFSYAFTKDMGEMSGVGLVVAMLAVKALESLGSELKFQIKWPNDIYLNGQKMGGILINLTAEAHGSCTAIIGMGLNINMKGMDLKDVGQPWISLEHALNEKLDRNQVIAQVLRSILEGLAIFQEKGIAFFLPRWKQYDLLENQMVCVNMGAKVVYGLAQGIDPQGYLLLKFPSGDLEKVSCGDATLLKNAPMQH